LISSSLVSPVFLLLQSNQVTAFAIFRSMGAVAWSVIFVLGGFSLLSWSVMIERYRIYRKALRQSREFLHALDQSRNLADLRDRCDRFSASPLVFIFKEGFRELTSQALSHDERRFAPPQTISSDVHLERRLARIQRVMDRAVLAENERLEAFLPVLATTGSVTPFVGLFGTVWGIMSAFQKIGVQGSASLGAVAPGISEALITTAAGLAAAIPAVIGYNYFLGQLRQANSAMDDFTMRFTAIVEQHLEGAVSPGMVESSKRRV
jgi:biopolymer transport protein TolQ